MANPEHLSILKEGPVKWNIWRLQNQDIRPNLSAVDLSKTILTGFDLREADLSGSTLREASLIETNLSRANLSNADLRAAHLFVSNFTLANLTCANLGQANLSGANLYLADLSEVNLERATLWNTMLIDVDLSSVRGLEDCNQEGPSSIDYRTLARSGKLPPAFLRGCGLPDNLISYLPSFLDEPLRFYSCFISYSSKDEEFAKRLHADLQDKGVRCWFAPEDMKIGDKIRTVIDESIRVYDKLLIILSEQSIQSAWVEKEVETAFDKENRQKQTVLFPIRLDNAAMDATEAWAAEIRHTHYIGNFSGWKDHDSYAKAFERLLRDLKATTTPAKK